MTRFEYHREVTTWALKLAMDKNIGLRNELMFIVTSAKVPATGSDIKMEEYVDPQKVQDLIHDYIEESSIHGFKLSHRVYDPKVIDTIWEQIKR